MGKEEELRRKKSRRVRKRDAGSDKKVTHRLLFLSCGMCVLIN